MADRLRTAAALVAAALLLVIAGCDGDDDPETQPTGDKVRVYSSLPLEAGPSQRQAAAIVAGIELALAERDGRAGELEVEYRSLNNASADDGGTAPGMEAGNARTAIQDDEAVAYIGSTSFEATAIAIPITGESGMVQVSPAATYDGLTKATAAAQRGEPDKYYPTELRNFARLVPIDSLQARVLAEVLAGAGCRDMLVAAAGDTASTALARALVAAARAAGVRLAGQLVVDPEEPDPDDATSAARESETGCAVFVGPASAAAAVTIERIAAALPDAHLFGSDGVCRRGFANPDAGLPRPVGDRLTCTSVTRDVEGYPGGEAIAAELDHPDPDAYALYGYEAMRLVLDAIEKGGRDREQVRGLVMATRDRESPLGTYSLDNDGDTTLDTYGVYRMRGGRLRLMRVARPGG